MKNNGYKNLWSCKNFGSNLLNNLYSKEQGKNSQGQTKIQGLFFGRLRLTRFKLSKVRTSESFEKVIKIRKSKIEILTLS